MVEAAGKLLALRMSRVECLESAAQRLERSLEAVLLSSRVGDVCRTCAGLARRRLEAPNCQMRHERDHLSTYLTQGTRIPHVPTPGYAAMREHVSKCVASRTSRPLAVSVPL